MDPKNTLQQMSKEMEWWEDIEIREYKMNKWITVKKERHHADWQYFVINYVWKKT